MYWPDEAFFFVKGPLKTQITKMVSEKAFKVLHIKINNIAKWSKFSKELYADEEVM